MVSGEAAIHQEFGGYSILGAATDFGRFKVMGLVSGQLQHQEQTAMLLGQQFGSCFYTVGIELGAKQRELTYSAAKAMTFFNVHQRWTLSVGVSAVSEKIAMPFGKSKTIDRSDIMGEIGAHFTQSFQGIKLMGDVGVRVFHGGQVQSAWFYHLSLISNAVKKCTFVSSRDVDINFSYEN